MFKINGESVNAVKAHLSIMYDNSLNPTGLGSSGYLIEHGDKKIFIGLKKDVLDIVTNFNLHTFVNIQEPETLLENSTYGTDNYEFDDERCYVVNLQNIELKIDVGALLVDLYCKNENWPDIIKALFKDRSSYGAILHYYSKLNVEQGLFNVGLLLTEEDDYWVINKNIVSKEKLNDEFRYSVWFIKQNVSTEKLTTYNRTKIFEPLTLDTEYVKYFNKMNDSIKQYNSLQFKTMPIAPNSNLAQMVNYSISDLNNDVYVINGTIRTPGIEGLFNKVNFGVKEARHGYWDLEKGKAFTNLGYKCSNFIWSDNFYIDTRNRYLDLIKSKFKLPVFDIIISDNFIKSILITELFISEEDAVKIIDSIKNMSLIEFYDKKISDNEAAVEIVVNKFMKLKINKAFEEKIRRSVNVVFSVPYLSAVKPTDISPGVTVFVSHPAFKKMFYYQVDTRGEINGKIISAINGHSFGIDEEKNIFIWKNIPKEYRADNLMYGYFGEVVYKDLCIDVPTISNKQSSSFTQDLKSWYNNANKSATVYVVKTDDLRRNMMRYNGVSNSEYVLGNKFGYVEV